MSNQYYDMGFVGQKKNCDRCGLPFYKKDLKQQKGWLVCEKCYDEPRRYDR